MFPQTYKHIRFFLICLAALFFHYPAAIGSGALLAPYAGIAGTPAAMNMLRFARQSILHELDSEIPEPEWIHPKNRLPAAGLYLTLMNGSRVRACLGGFSASALNLEDRIRQLAQSVIYADIRSRPVSRTEMNTLSVVLSFAGPIREVADPYQIDFTSEGLLIAQGPKSAVLLPGETKTIDYGVRKMFRQQRFDPDYPIRYAAFDVVVFDERKSK